MNEEARKKLYSQLIQMSESNMKEDAQSIISEEEFNAMSDKEILKYVFEYRDNQTCFEIDGKECIAYIELPDMNLEGQDLSDVHLSKFMLGEVEDNNGYYKISRVSSVNLKDTNATIDLSKIQPNKVSEEYNIKEFSIDFTSSNFNGCDIYGMLPDEYSQGGMYGRLTKEISVIGKEEALDEKYLQRRKEHHLSEEDKKISDRAYERIINGESLKGMRGVNEKIDLTDYDFSGTDLTTLYKEFEERDIDLNLLSKYLPEIEKADKKLQKLIIDKYIEHGNTEFLKNHFEKVHKDNKDKILKLAYEQDDLEFIEKHFKGLIEIKDKDVRVKILTEEYEKGNLDFVESYFKGEYYYFDLKEMIKLTLQKGNEKYLENYFGNLKYKYEYVYEIMALAYKQGKIKFVDEHFKKIYDEIEIRVIEIAYEQGNIEFVEKYLDQLDSWDKGKILKLAYEQKDLEFVENHFEYATYEIQEKIIKKHYNQHDIEFVEKHLEYATDEIQEELIKKHYNQGDIEFVEKHLEYATYEIQEKIIKKHYNEDDIKFIEKHFEILNSALQYDIIKIEYKKGNVEFVEKHFVQRDSWNRSKITAIAYEQGNMEFLYKYFNQLDSWKKEKIIKIAYEQLNMEFLYKYFNQLDSWDKGKILKLAYEQGNIEFVDKHFKEICFSYKIEMIELAYKKSDIKFVEKRFEESDINEKREIVKTAYEQNDIEFVEKHLEYATDKVKLELIKKHYNKKDNEFVEKHFEEYKYEIVKFAYEQGDIGFVDKKFSELDVQDKRKIIKLAHEQDDMKFVKKYFDFAAPEMKCQVMALQLKNQDMEFVEKYFGKLIIEHRNEIIKLAYKQGESVFVEKYYENISGDVKRKIINLAHDKGDLAFIRQIFNKVETSLKEYIVKLTKDEELGKKLADSVQFDELNTNSKQAIIQMKYGQGDIEFVKQRFNEGDNSLKEYIARCTKEPEFVKYFVDKEKEKVITQGKKEVLASGLMLEEELNMSESELDVDYIKALIDAGINVDFKSYKNVDRSSPEYTPMLYKALQIKDDEKRRAVVESMLRAGVDVTAKYKKIEYYGDGSKETKEVSCLYANDGELVQIMQELGIGMSTKQTPNVGHQVQDNKEVVTDFLRSTVRLTDEEIRELENLMSGFGRDLYQESVDNNLQAKKDILDACNATKQGFTKEARILTNDVKTLYARLKFFIENQINIIPDRLNTTLGISRKAFDKNYGKYLVEDLEIDDDNYSGQVKKSLLSRYPMPQTREELLKELEMLINREMGEI